MSGNRKRKRFPQLPLLSSAVTSRSRKTILTIIILLKEDRTRGNRASRFNFPENEMYTEWKDRAICVGGQGLQILSSDEFATIFQYIFFFNTFRDLNYCLLNRKETWFIFENFFENYMKSNVLSLWAHELLAEACNETHFCGCLVLFVSY